MGLSVLALSKWPARQTTGVSLTLRNWSIVKALIASTSTWLTDWSSPRAFRGFVNFDEKKGKLAALESNSVTDYRWWFRNPANQLRLVYSLSHVRRILYIQTVVGLGISDINSSINLLQWQPKCFDMLQNDRTRRASTVPYQRSQIRLDSLGVASHSEVPT